MNVNNNEVFSVNMHSIANEDVECNDLNSINSSNGIIESQALDGDNNNRLFTTTKMPFKIDMAELKLFLHKYINKTIDFITVKNELSQQYSNNLLNQITEPIYLMGLLHLATENNLKLINCSDNSVKIEQLI